MNSIFDEKNKVKANWMKFLKIGDKVQGTLIAKRVVLNQLSGKDQIIYELKVPESTNVVIEGEDNIVESEEYWNVGGKPGIDMQTKRIKLGQLVGFEFAEEKENKTPGMNNLKVIQVYADPKKVDEKWIAEQEESKTLEDFPEDIDDSKIFDGDKKEEEIVVEEKPELSKTEMLKQINALATKKLDAKGPADVKNKVMEETNLAFIDGNLPEILEQLEEL